MKRNLLLALLSAVVLNFSNCEKPNHPDDKEKKRSCFHTVAYWKTHPDEWQEKVFGWSQTLYTKEQAMVTLRTPTKGNDLLAVFQEYIALRLNSAGGAYCEDLGWALVGTQDYMYGLTKEGQFLPPYGDAFDNSKETKDLAKYLQAINEGKQLTNCCGESVGK